MSNIEKIKAEIERLYDGEAPKHDQQCEFEDGYFTGIATISKFIDSLPDEEPSKDLEEEIERYFYYEYTDNTPNEAIARHFAEWGRKQVLQEIYDGKIHPVDSITAAWL